MPTPPRVSPVRVLVVDDSADLCASMSLLLRLWGHEAQIARDGPSALTLAASYRPEVILLDLGLPCLNGFEVARRLRSQADLGRPLLLAVSGFGREEDRRLALEAGCDMHFLKPVDPDMLQRLLENVRPARSDESGLRGGIPATLD